MVSTLDFFPTFSAAAGAKVPTDRIYDGYNLLPTLKGQAPSPRDNYKYFLGADLQAIRQGPWKYRKVGQNPPELYHLDFDPAEQYNVHDRNPDLAQSLASRLAADRVNI
jgi:arylsulfatase A-like enzyme